MMSNEISNEELWGVTTFFNPMNHKVKIDNFRDFRETSKKQGLNLCVVELLFDDSDPVLEETRDAEKVIHMQVKNKKGCLWQKECLLNIGMKSLPEECTKVCWLDADIFFCNDNWVTELSALLDEVPIAQPFVAISLLPKNWRSSTNKLLEVEWWSHQRTLTSYAYTKVYQAMRGQNVQALVDTYPSAIDSQCFGRYEYIYSKSKEEDIDDNVTACIASGYAWAARRDVLEAFGGLYERCVIGGGDAIFMIGLENESLPPEKVEYFSKAHQEDINEYLTRLNGVLYGQSIGCVDGKILHMYHGKIKNRNYYDRHYILRDLRFDPYIDLKKRDDGLIVWSDEARKKLRKKVRKYFKMRKEGK